MTVVSVRSELEPGRVIAAAAADHGKASTMLLDIGKKMDENMIRGGAHD
jgi:hypothetical protein